MLTVAKMLNNYVPPLPTGTIIPHIVMRENPAKLPDAPKDLVHQMAREARKEEIRRRILAAIDDDNERLGMIIAASGISFTTVRRYIGIMEKEGILTVDRVKGLPGGTTWFIRRKS